jgi:hypothetical protein
MSSESPLKADIAQYGRHVSKVRILLQKSFWGDERRFLEPLMRFTRGDVRDYIVSSKLDHGRVGIAFYARSDSALTDVFARH